MLSHQRQVLLTRLASVTTWCPFSWPNQRVILALGTSMEAHPCMCVSEGWGAWQKALLSVVFGQRLVPARDVRSEKMTEF